MAIKVERTDLFDTLYSDILLNTVIRETTIIIVLCLINQAFLIRRLSFIFTVLRCY